MPCSCQLFVCCVCEKWQKIDINVRTHPDSADVEVEVLGCYAVICYWLHSLTVVYWCLHPGVVITPLVIHASRGNTRRHHSDLSDVTNNAASLRLSSESHSGSVTAPDMRSPASSSSLSRACHHHHHHHHVCSSASVDSSSVADGQVKSEIVIRPAYDNQLPLKRLHSSSEILPAAISKVTSIDAPLEQLSLPPPLIPVPSSQSVAVSKHASSGTRTRTQTHVPRRSLASTPPPVPVRRSVGSVRQTTSSAPPTVAPPVDATVICDTTNTGDAPSNECVVCLERAPDCVLYTCGHMCMCHSCARDVVQHRGALCPICRQSIRDVIKIFRSWTSNKMTNTSLRWG